MIIQIEDKLELQFGNGDISIESCICNDENNGEVGVVVFNNIEPSLIGESSKSDWQHSINKSPIIITFSKKESIDVLIDKLNYIKVKLD